MQEQECGEEELILKETLLISLKLSNCWSLKVLGHPFCRYGLELTSFMNSYVSMDNIGSQEGPEVKILAPYYRAETFNLESRTHLHLQGCQNGLA